MMNIRAIILIIAIFILSSNVYAGLSVPSDLDIGGSDVDKFGSNGDPSTVTKTFTLQASDPGSNVSYINIQYIFTPNDFPLNNLNITNLPPTIISSGSLIITVQIEISEDFSSVNADLEETDFNIGNLKIKYDTMNTTTNQSIQTNQESNQMDLNLQIENGLSMPSLKLKVGSSENSVSKGSTVTVHANDEIELIFTVRNKFNNNSADFNTVNLKVKSDDLNIDEDGEITDLEAGEEKSKSIDFDVEDETGTFDIDLEVKGTDEFGGLHGFEYDFKLKVDPEVITNENEGEDEDQIPDSDEDGVSDLDDFCPNTFSQCEVDSRGCETDTDNDGICNTIDPTPGTEIQQTTQSSTQVQSSDNNEPKNETVKKEKKESAGSEGFIPFIIGFIIGMILTAAFFILIKS